MSAQRSLAVVYNPRSRPWAEIVDAAPDGCRLLWVIDSSAPGVQLVADILRKFGTVLDIAGRSLQQVIQLVHAQRPAGITSYSDNDLHLQAWLAEALGLPSPSVRSTACLTDKLLQRMALEAAGVPQPRFSDIREPVDEAELERIAGTLSFPVLLKPRDGSGCRGISQLDDAPALASALATMSHPAQFIVEERMADCQPPGSTYADRVSVDSVVSGGTIHHLGVTGLFSMVPPFRSSGGFFPAQVEPEDARRFFALATASIEAVGADFGCYRTEIKLSPDGYRIIEINGRPTGLTPATVKLASGVPLLDLTMKLALGEPVSLETPLACSRIGYRFYAEPPMSARRVIAVAGLEELRDLPGEVRVDVHKSPGDPVDWQNGSLDKIFQVTGAVQDYAELAEHYRACTEDVVVTYEPGS